MVSASAKSKLKMIPHVRDMPSIPKADKISLRENSTRLPRKQAAIMTISSKKKTYWMLFITDVKQSVISLMTASFISESRSFYICI